MTFVRLAQVRYFSANSKGSTNAPSLRPLCRISMFLPTVKLKYTNYILAFTILLTGINCSDECEVNEEFESTFYLQIENAGLITREYRSGAVEKSLDAASWLKKLTGISSSHSLQNIVTYEPREFRKDRRAWLKWYEQNKCDTAKIGSNWLNHKTGLEKRKKEYPSKWVWDDWIPIIMRESDTTNYYNLNGTGVDTIYAGDLFKAKLFFPIREFYDSAGNNSIQDDHQMHFMIGPDTFPKYTTPNLTKIDKYLTVVKDTGYLEIPIDSIVSKYSWESILWRAAIQPTLDTVYQIEGVWIIKSDRVE